MSAKRFVLALMLAFAPLSLAHADEAGDALIAERGLTLQGGMFVLEGEQAITRQRRTVQSAQRDLLEAERDFRQAERQIAQAQAYIAQLQAEMDELRSRLRRADTQREYDRRATALEQKAAEIEEIQEQRQAFEDEQQLLIDEARAAYLTVLFELVEEADVVAAQYAELAEDEPLAQAITAKGEADNRRYTLGPSRPFERMREELARSAEEYSAGVVDLRREGNILMIDVRINGNPIRSMILDTGAGSMSLPYAFASDLGITPDENTAQIQVQMADGKIVDAWRMQLDSVQVGQFLVRDVDCIVLPEELHAAPALLGNSFLSHFTFNVDPERGKLLLSRIDPEDEEEQD
ncbi:MAG: TIGR02281 family clan AA aspartic protease [Phycisphaerales bacterium JB063]